MASLSSSIVSEPLSAYALENKEVSSNSNQEKVEESNVENDSEDELEKEEIDILVEEKESSNIESKSEDKEEIEESNIINQSTQGFNLSDWQITETTTSIILKGYNGNDTEIVIPGEYNGKQIILDNLKIFPENMLSLEIKEVNSKKVKVNFNVNSQLNNQFMNCKKLKIWI